jgi:hypothetical protein
MEALQIVKFSLKQKRLHFTDGWMTAEPDMQDNDVDDAPDLLHNLSICAENSSDELMVIITVICVGVCTCDILNLNFPIFSDCHISSSSQYYR